MNFLRKIKRKLAYLLYGDKTLLPSAAYNIWATTYDTQTDNPLIFLDEMIFEKLLCNVALEGKAIVDVGCGTGRHWKKILEQNPAQMIGYDLSEEMLKRLRQKFPNAITYVASDNRMKELPDESCDIIFSNLTIGYIENIQELFNEWNRVLKKNGEIIISDFHPDALQKGAKRAFKHNSQNIVIKNHIHTLATVRTTVETMNWKELKMIEKRIDDTIRHFYEKNHSLATYNKSLNEPIMYGLHLKKNVS